MKKISTDTLLLPEEGFARVICGGTLVEWDYAVVYTHDKYKPYDPPTHFYFTILGSGDYYLEEVITLVEQWTFYRGRCHRVYQENEHEFFRARKMACQMIGTYRRNYLAEYGQRPNPLGLVRTLDNNFANRATEKLNRKKLGENYDQLLLNFELEIPTENPQ